MLSNQRTYILLILKYDWILYHFHNQGQQNLYTSNFVIYSETIFSVKCGSAKTLYNDICDK
jgi:hypothetical protein